MLRPFNPIFEETPRRTRVKHGGVGPTPGTVEARQAGCICPGRVGHRDAYGNEGFTVYDECARHGTEARREQIRLIREDSRRFMEWLDKYDSAKGITT